MAGRRSQRTLATVLFTDIVGSSEVASELGDRRWRVLLGRHHEVVRRELRRYGGKEIDTAGDGFFASFGAQADAIRCACAAARAVRELGIEIRAGLHVGEAEVVGHKLGGVAVHIGARVAALAGPGEVLVTAVLKDLVPGSGFGFEDRGVHALKGIEGEWRIFAVTRIDREPVSPPLEEDAAAERRSRIQPATDRRRRRVGIAVGGAVAIAVAAAVAIALTRAHPSPPAHRAAAPMPHVLLKLDPGTGRVLARIPIGVPATVSTEPGPGPRTRGLAAGEGSIWVTDQGDDSVLRIDPVRARVVARIHIPSPNGVAVGRAAVWVATDVGPAFMIDPGTNRATSVTLPGVAAEPLDVAADQTSGRAFVASLACFACPIPKSGVVAASITVVDAAGVVGEPILLGSSPVTSDALIADGSLWTTAGGNVWRIDPATREVLARIPVSGTLESLVADPAGSSVWVARTQSNGEANDVVEIDAATNHVVGTGVPVGCCPGELAAGDGQVWVTDARQGTVSRISEETGEVQQPFRVGPGADAVVVGEGAVWVAVDHAGVVVVPPPGG